MKAPKIPVSGIIRIRKPKPDPKKRAAEAINRPPVTETQSKKGRKDGDIKPPVKTERKTGKGAGKQLFVSGDPRGRPGPGRPPTPPEVKELLKANTVPSILFLAELVSIGREELAEARRRKEELQAFYAADCDRSMLPMELSRPVTIEVDVRSAIRAAEILLDRALGKPKQDVSIEGLEGVTITIAPPEEPKV